MAIFVSISTSAATTLEIFYQTKNKKARLSIYLLESCGQINLLSPRLKII